MLDSDSELYFYGFVSGILVKTNSNTLTSCATLPPGDMNSSLVSVRLQSIHESRVGVGTGELLGLMWGDESDGSVS